MARRKKNELEQEALLRAAAKAREAGETGLESMYLGLAVPDKGTEGERLLNDYLAAVREYSEAVGRWAELSGADEIAAEAQVEAAKQRVETAHAAWKKFESRCG